MKYSASERRWVMRLLAKMTPAERAEYERRKERLYDNEDFRFFPEKRGAMLVSTAERVMLEMRG